MEPTVRPARTVRIPAKTLLALAGDIDIPAEPGKDGGKPCRSVLLRLTEESGLTAELRALSLR